MKRPKMPVLATPAEAGQILGLTAGAVRAMEARGELPSWRTLSGRRLYLVDDVKRLQAKRAAAAKKGR